MKINQLLNIIELVKKHTSATENEIANLSLELLKDIQINKKKKDKKEILKEEKE